MKPTIFPDWSMICLLLRLSDMDCAMTKDSPSKTEDGTPEWSGSVTHGNDDAVFGTGTANLKESQTVIFNALSDQG